MRRLQAFLLFLALAPASLLAQYSYYYTNTLTSYDGGYENGMPQFGASGFYSTYADGGSLIFSIRLANPG